MAPQQEAPPDEATKGADDMVFAGVHTTATEGSRDVRRAMRLLHELFAACLETPDPAEVRNAYAEAVHALYRLGVAMKDIRHESAPETVAMNRRIRRENQEQVAAEARMRAAVVQRVLREEGLRLAKARAKPGGRSRRAS